jgi:uncharacterized CHY-type Zn-finger protein
MSPTEAEGTEWEQSWDTTEPGGQSFKCGQCGAKMTFVPGSTAQKCPYCDHENAIPQGEEDIEELDYHAFLHQAMGQEDMIDRLTIKCESCGAESTFEDNITAKHCVFCGMDVVSTAHSTKVIKPKSLLPFNIDKRKAHQNFQKWIQKLWFAPNALKKMATSDSGLTGMYVPYWTYDSDTTTFYRGQRGDHYYETETYTTTENGKTVTKTRQVRKTRWRSVSGTVWRNFDDVLIMASHSLPRKYADKLQPWDLKNLTPYRDEFLSGFRAESYQVDLQEGFNLAKGVMGKQIDRDIKHDIGGDEQRISSKKTRHDSVTFKHILLPIWLNAYRFKEKSFRFLVNGRTGEVQGERPWDYLKIALTAGGIAALIGGLYWLFAM